MTSKTISITEDVYDVLFQLRLEGESFSDTIRRLAKRDKLSECAGLWADLPEEEFEAIRDGLLEARKGLDKSMRRAGSRAKL